MYDQEIDEIKKYLQSKHPLFYIQHPDFFAVRDIIEALIKELEKSVKHDAGYVFDVTEFNASSGWTKFKNQDSYSIAESTDRNDLNTVLTDLETNGEISTDENYIPEEKHLRFFIIEDMLDQISANPELVAHIKSIAEKSFSDENFTLVIFIAESSYKPFPKELESLLTVVDVNPLSENDIEDVIKEFKLAHNEDIDFRITEKENEVFVGSLKGLHKFQITQILNTARIKSKRENHKRIIDSSAIDIVNNEKKQLIKKSGILEIINSVENVDSIGGLEKLKSWLKTKAEVFKDFENAKKYGVKVPKGILIVGMPGCGKSLTAKATASMFNVPLVRLDIGSLLGKYVGESEANMRKALSLSEAFAPCVLWIDELEKAFSGIQNGGEGNQEVTRMFGRFLTWMQEKQSPVFIVATANSIKTLPPEFLRKGRFDELFKVELPTEKELVSILNTKLKEYYAKIGKIKLISVQVSKKKISQSEIEQLAKIALDKKPSKKVLENLGSKENWNGGCNGGDIEAILNEAIEKRFEKSKNGTPEDKILTFEDLKSVLEDPETKSVSQTLTAKILQLRNELENYPFRNASEN